MPRWTATRFALERSFCRGMAVRRRRPSAEPSPDSMPGTLVYIHGLGESSYCFEQVICDPRLAARDHVAPDLVGYGKSSWDRGAVGVEQHAEHLEALIEELELRQVLLVGHSMGGVIGLYLARRLHARDDIELQGFINIEGNISPSDCTGSALAAAQSLDEWLTTGFDDYLASLTEPVDEADASQERGAVLRAYFASASHADPRTFHLNSRDLVRESATETLASRLADLDVPQIYIHGTPRGTGPRSLELLAEAGIPARPVNGAGHWPYLDQHEVFVDHVVDFLG